MAELIYCNNADCPWKDCKMRNKLTAKRIPDGVRIGNLGGICRRYVYWLANKAETGRR